jgi:hypothetical protein
MEPRWDHLTKVESRVNSLGHQQADIAHHIVTNDGHRVIAPHTTKQFLEDIGQRLPGAPRRGWGYAVHRKGSLVGLQVRGLPHDTIL